MVPKRCLLVVIDPTAESQPALEKAVKLAEKTASELILLDCVYDPYIAGDRFFDGPDLELLRSNLLDERLANLKTLASPLAERGLNVDCRVVWDTPLHEAIVRETFEIRPDIVFKDTHHHSVLSRALFTNTDWHLIRDCPATLWLAKPSTGAERSTVMAAVEPTHEHDEPAALDHKIIEEAQYVSAICDGQPLLVHTYNLPTEAVVSGYSTLPASVSPPPVYERNVEQVRQYHADAVGRLAEDLHCPAERIHLRQGYATELLPKLAEELGAAVVVMGAVARSRLQRAIVGSTAERTLDRFSCDVVVVKPEGFVSAVDTHSDAEGYIERDGSIEAASVNAG